MNTDDLESLFRNEPVPEAPASARGRVRARLADSLAAASVAPTPSRSGGLARAAGIFAGGAILGGVIVGSVVSSPIAAPPLAPSISIVPTSAPPTAPVVVREPIQEPVEVDAGGGAPRVTRPIVVDDLDAERAILDDARTKLTSGDAATALTRTGDHLAKFRRGQLSDEREAIAIQALVTLGRYDDARARAARLRAASPASVFLPAVDVALGSIP